MPDWLVQVIVGSVIATGLGLLAASLGLLARYELSRYRGRIKVSLETHIEQSWSDCRILISITNHGNTPIVVDSWTVHMPLEDLFPKLASRLPNRESETEPPLPKRFSGIRRAAWRIRRLVCRQDRLAIENEISRLFAHSILNEPDWRHELLEPGSTQQHRTRRQRRPQLSSNQHGPTDAYCLQHSTTDYHPLLPHRWAPPP